MNVSGRLLSLLVAAVLLLTAAPVSAHKQTKTDPNDTQGALDIRELSFRDRNGKFRLTLTTFGEWTIADMQSGKNTDHQFLFSLDSRGNEKLDYSVIVDALGGEMVAAIYRDSDMQLIAKIPAFKNGKTAGVAFRKGRVDPRSSFVKWGGASQTMGNRLGCGGICRDTAPNNVSNLYTHEL